jgi:hypothetical protein
MGSKIRRLGFSRVHDAPPVEMSPKPQTQNTQSANKQVLTIPSERVKPGRLYIGVHAVGGSSSRFLLSAAFRCASTRLQTMIFQAQNLKKNPKPLTPPTWEKPKP